MVAEPQTQDLVIADSEGEEWSSPAGLECPAIGTYSGHESPEGLQRQCDICNVQMLQLDLSPDSSHTIQPTAVLQPGDAVAVQPTAGLQHRAPEAVQPTAVVQTEACDPVQPTAVAELGSTGAATNAIAAADTGDQGMAQPSDSTAPLSDTLPESQDMLVQPLPAAGLSADHDMAYVHSLDSMDASPGMTVLASCF